MPEIPDLNVFNRNLKKKLLGKTLSKINVLIDRRLKVSDAALKEAFEGQKLIAIKRIGKELHFEFQNGHILGLQLMLYGTMYWV